MLKKLEIQGFKSFADRVELDFAPGLTVIIGPNGSGKSNIADAINWVIGEQRASALRGTRMDDIIFAGSDKRRSLGMCQVSLTLDNSQKIFPLEYTEITITRRVFRSGESQFMINKVPCRLKDIHNILLDTGIGRGAYAIIGQGKVDQILQNRPEERRLVIEEASGIIKYRQRKEEAMRKLKDTQQDLLRLGDIIAEIHQRLEPLAKEAQRAKQWHQYEEQKRSLELGLLARELTSVEEKLLFLGEQLKDLNQSNTDQHKNAALLVRDLEAKLNTENSRLEELRQLVTDLQTDLQDQKHQLTLTQEKINSCQQEQQWLNQKRATATERQQQLAIDCQREEQKLQQIKAELAPKGQALEQLGQQYVQIDEEIKKQESLLEENKSLIIQLMNDAAQGKSKLQRAEERKRSVEHRLSQLRSAAQNNALERKRIKEKFLQVQGSIKSLNTEIDTGRQNVLAIEREKQDVKKQLQEFRTQIDDVKEKLTSNKSKYRLLVEMAQSYSNYQRGVRDILLALKTGKVNLQGVCGPVADIIQVPASLELAIETALGGALQNLVTETDTVARDLINYLKQHKLGRVTFLPLNTIRPAPRHGKEKQALTMPGIIGVAADLVRYNPRYQRVVEYLLGKVLVAENIDYALQAARASGQTLRLVTLEGESLYPGGSLSGGSNTAKGGGLLKAKREHREYAQRVKSLERLESELASKEKELLAALARLDDTLQQQRDLLVQKQVSLAAQEQTLMQLQEALAAHGARKQEYNYEVTNLEREIEQYDEAQGLAAKQVAQAEGRLKLVHNEIEEVQSRLVELKEKQRHMEQQVTAMKVELATAEQQKTALANLLQRLKKEYNDVTKEIKEIDQALANNQHKQEQLAEQRINIEDKINSITKELQQKEMQLLGLQQQKKHLQGQLDAAREELKLAEQEQQRYLEQLHKIQLQQTRLETEKQGMMARLEQEFNILSRDQLPKPVENPQQTKQKINEIKKLLEQIGPVNPAAEQEYEQLLARYNYLSQQKQDLDESKQSLQQLIAEMDTLMAKKFSATFHQVAREFKEIFRELFGGGSANITMVGDNPLTAGIEIEARPPGKKLQNISLLSGGERSLTAIALLFAILRVKPSPFCVLDEIDAALDEANVDRFAQFLQRISTVSPFVVISHRKGTMERADTIYGVTMGNTGSSQVFSMKIAQGEAAASRS